MYRHFQTTSCASSAHGICVTRYCSGFQLNPVRLSAHGNYNTARIANLSGLPKTSTPAPNVKHVSRLCANVRVYRKRLTAFRYCVADHRGRKQVRPARCRHAAPRNRPKSPVDHTETLRLSHPEIPSEPTECSARPPYLACWIPAPDITDSRY